MRFVAFGTNEGPDQPHGPRTARKGGESMQGGLKALREAAGYASARSFAEAQGIPAATYTRYEKDPSRIPLRAAWELADALDATVDQVIGRDKSAPDSSSGAVQRAYDGLSRRSREEVRDLIEFFRQRDEREARDTEAMARARWGVIFSRIERHYLGSLAEGSGQSGPVELLLTGSDEEIREGFEELVRSWLAGVEGPLNPYAPDIRGEEAIGAVMEAYDRAHANDASFVCGVAPFTGDHHTTDGKEASRK